MALLKNIVLNVKTPDFENTNGGNQPVHLQSN